MMKNEQKNKNQNKSKLNQIKKEQQQQNKKYQQLELIGQGTFGKVYKVKDKNSKIFALKIVLQDKKYKNRELSIITKVKHHNIVILHDHYFKYQAEECYLNLVMEFIPQTLANLFKKYRKQKISIDPQLLKVYSFQMFKALAYLEDISLCHRDIKPQNILINPETHELKICDFGSAKILKPNQDNVSYICSRFYRAPQLLLGAKDYWTQIDVWSIGCILVQLLTFQPLFPGQSTLQQMIQIIKVLGTPSKQYLKSCKVTQEDIFRIPSIKSHSWKSLLKKYKPQQNYIDLIQKTLSFDRRKRIKPVEALLHPYFEDLKSQRYKKYIQKNVNLLDFSDNQMNGYNNKKELILSRFENIDKFDEFESTVSQSKE